MMPQSKPASASSKVAAVWPADTTTPASVRASDYGLRARQLGRHRHHRHAAGGRPILDQVEARAAHQIRIVDARPLGREHRAF